MGLEKTRSINAGNIFILGNIVFLGLFSFAIINFPMQEASAGAGSGAGIGEIIWFGALFNERSTANCDGQLLPISQNTALFSLLGTIYGGDGRTSFALPDLRGRAPLDDGSGPGLTPRTLGIRSGSQTVTLTIPNLPSHTHTLQASGTDGGLTNPSNNVLGTGTHPFTHRIFSNQMADTPLDNQALTSTGGGQPHNNMNPFLTIRCLINLDGFFPTRSGALGPSDPILGEIRYVGFNFAPGGWARCDGQLLLISQNTALFSLLGTTYGGDGETTFGLPDMRGRVPLHHGPLHNIGDSGGNERGTLTTNQMPSHSHTLRAFSENADTINPSSSILSASESAVYGLPNNLVSMHSSSILPTGSSGSHENMPPFLGLNCIIALTGIYPEDDKNAGDPFISQIKWLAHDVVPTNYERCNGQLLSIASNQSFFALVGTTYGGDGRTTFGIPDMRDRMPIHTGTGPGLSPRFQGSVGGTETVTLTTNQIPSHTHTLQAFDGTGDDTDPTNRVMHEGHHPFLHRIYNTQNPDASMHPTAISNTGGGQSHDNMPPYLTINCIIAKTGVFPSRN